MNKDDIVKIDFLYKEKEGLREEIILLLATNYKTIFTYFLISLSFVGVYFDLIIQQSNPILKGYLLLIITQFGYFTALFLLSVTTNMNVHGGYIRGIEHCINQISDGEIVTKWETSFVSKYLWSPKGVFFYIESIMIIIIVLIYILCAALVVDLFDVKIWFIMLYSIELILFFGIFYFSILETEKINQDGHNLLVNLNKNDQKKGAKLPLS